MERLFGRRKIKTMASEITRNNVVSVLAEVIGTHNLNSYEINYLYNYYRGDQPVLYRTKERNDFINNKVVENRAFEIVKFQTGYRVGNPIQYVSRKSDTEISDSVSLLNDYLYDKAKAKQDADLVRWQCICGTAYRLVLPDFMTVPDPRRTFVIYSADVYEKPMAGVYYSDDGNGKVYTVYTDAERFVIKDDVVVAYEAHTMGAIPIIEYPSGNDRLGVFEPVLPLLDAINEIDSNRVDGIAQFIQSLLVLYGVDLPNDETGATIKEKGVIVLPPQDTNGTKADVKILSEQLNQADTQTVKNDLYKTVLTIVGMPEQSSTSDSSNNGAIMFKQGWQSAEARAQEFEQEFKQPEMQFIRLVISYLSKIAGLVLAPSDVMIKFTRRNYEDILSKANVLTMLLGNEYVARIDAFTVCGLFPDPEESCRRGIEFHDMTAEEIATEIADDEELIPV